MAQRFPAYTMRDDVLYLLGSESDWATLSSLRLSYTAQPADLTADASTIVLPADAREPLAARLCAFYLWRLVSDPLWKVTPDMAQVWDGKADAEDRKFLARIARTGQRQSYRVRDVT